MAERYQHLTTREIIKGLKSINDRFTNAILPLAIELMAYEGDRITGPSVKDPRDLLVAYGILDETQGYIKECRLIPKNDSPAMMIWLVLEQRKSWGEFIGGILASWPSWDEKDRIDVYPSLSRALTWAVKHGVDG